MPLTDAAVRQAKPREKPYKMGDAFGLYIEITPNGSKLWRLKYRLAGKENRSALGAYPEVSLAKAREKRDEDRKLIAQGLDPVEARRQEQLLARLAASNTFEAVANEWLEYNLARWAKDSGYKVSLYLKKDLLPTLGKRPIADITRPELVDLIRKIEDRKTFDVARKSRQWLKQIFRFAIAKGLVQYNPATDLDIVAASAPTVKHHPFIPFSEFPAFLQALENYSGNYLTIRAVKLLMLTAVRPGELRNAPWEEFDLKNALWTIPAVRMKMRRPHLVPLPRQAVEILRELEAFSGSYRFVFIGRNDPDRPMSENTINKCLADLGYKKRMTGHGFRHLLSTELNDRGYNKDWIERQLAHGDNNGIRDTYNHAGYLEQRRAMIQRWADDLDQSKSSPSFSI